ncbi:MAG: YbjN domain-containing protein [Muribaculaceae bacterium]|nr:YbjN domain-containing protein [Muribaculaceae bacterium]
MTSKELVKKTLEKWHFPVLQEADNVLTIRYQMNYVSIGTLSEDNTCIAVSMSGLFKVENDKEMHLVLKACNELNFSMMLVKLYIDNDDDLVIGAEFFYRTEDDVEYLLRMALQAVVAAKKKFVRQYEAVVEEDKLLQELNGDSNN